MNKLNIRAGVIVVMIVLAALSRLLPHPYNFSPLVAIALFGGAQFRKKWLAIIIPLAAYLISDIALQASGAMGEYSFAQPFVIVSQFFVYGAMLLIALLGTTLREPKTIKIAGYSLTGSALFWIISNFGVWVGNHFAAGTIMHEPGLTLGITYLRALPFYNLMSAEMFLNAFVGDLFYCAVLFGVFALMGKQHPKWAYSEVNSAH